MSFWTWEHSMWPTFHIDEDRVASVILSTETLLGKLDDSLVWLPKNSSESLQIDTICLEGVGTAAIEGIAIDPQAVRSSIAKKLGANSAGWVSPPREVEGLVAVLLQSTELWGKPLTKEILCSWHGALFPTGRSNLQPIVTAAYRQDPIHIVSGGIMGKEDKIHYTAVPADRVAAEMERFLAWFNATSGDPSLTRAAKAHFWFEAIHPFEDGNGRIGRVILDLALSQRSQSPMRFLSLSHQLSKKRTQYVNQMGMINRVKDNQSLNITSWVEFFLEQVTEATLYAQKGVDMALVKNKFWGECSQVNLNERQRKVINKILEAGPEGFVGGVNNSRYSSMGKTSRATATRDLAELKDLGLMKVEGGGRSRAYHFDWERWTPKKSPSKTFQP